MDLQKTKQLREMSSEQLEGVIRESQRDLFKLRFESTTEKLDSPSNLRKIRRQIARIKTLLRERELDTAVAGA